MSRTIIGTAICFALGVALGSLAPFAATLGQTSMLTRLIIDTWRRYLLDEDWWIWSLGGGLEHVSRKWSPVSEKRHALKRRPKAHGANLKDRDAL